MPGVSGAGWGEVEEGEEGSNGDGQRLDLGGEHTVHVQMICCEIVHVTPV